MELSCPHIIWKIFPFNSTNNSVTKSFKFLNCDWRWEYSIQTEFHNEMSEETVSIYLKRLTSSSASSLRKVSAVVSIKGSEGKHNAVRVVNIDKTLLVSWCIWQKPKSYILVQNVVQNNSCSFSLALEPSSFLKDPSSFSNDKNYDAPCLQELSKDFDKLLKCSRHADIILKCDNLEIKSHKDVLSFRSIKLADMIEKDNFGDSSVENVQRITLSTMEPGVFEALIRFIYTSTLPDLTNELAKEIYHAAKDYGIDSLKKKCAQFMIEHLSISNAIQTFKLADACKDYYLRWAARSFIAHELNNFLYTTELDNLENENNKLHSEVYQTFIDRYKKEHPETLLV